MTSTNLLSGSGSSSVSVSINVGWNLISVPVHRSNNRAASLFPTAISGTFSYNGAYFQQDSLTPGIGYWIKFPIAVTQSIPGTSITSVEVTVSEGWNLIGSISQSLPITEVTSNPPGLITSQFFGYQSRYNISNTIEPGKAYWVKVHQSGTLNLSSSTTASATSIRIVPTSELPPQPPPGGIHGETVPAKFALEQNYPNPFNPSTIINYQLPIDNYVTLKVYDVIGQEVATLVNEMQDAGYKSVTWDASNVPSGIYLLRLNAGGFVEVKKLLLMK